MDTMARLGSYMSHNLSSIKASACVPLQVGGPTKQGLFNIYASKDGAATVHMPHMPQLMVGRFKRPSIGKPWEELEANTISFPLLDSSGMNSEIQ